MSNESNLHTLNSVENVYDVSTEENLSGSKNGCWRTPVSMPSVGKSLSLRESAGCGLFGGEPAISKPTMATTRSGETRANSVESTPRRASGPERRIFECPACGRIASIRLDYGVCVECVESGCGGDE